MSHKILVVDDDAGIRDTLRMILEYEGYEVATSPDGRTALVSGELAEPVRTEVRVALAGPDRKGSFGGCAVSLPALTGVGRTEIAGSRLRTGSPEPSPAAPAPFVPWPWTAGEEGTATGPRAAAAPAGTRPEIRIQQARTATGRGPPNRR